MKVVRSAQKIVLSTQHDADASQSDIRKLVTPVIADILPDGWMVGEDDLLVNPTGNFVIGGPDGDAGLTGRKIIVDTLKVVRPRMAAARFQARTRPRLTVPQPMRRAILRRTSSRPGLPIAVPSRSPTPSALPSRSRSMPIPMVPARLKIRGCRRRLPRPWR